MHFMFDWKKRGDHQAVRENILSKDGIEELYRLYRVRFMGYMQKRYQLGEEEISDIYHDSFLLMIDNIRTGKYQQQDASLFTYLLGIGKNRVLKKFQKETERPLGWVAE